MVSSCILSVLPQFVTLRSVGRKSSWARLISLLGFLWSKYPLAGPGSQEALGRGAESASVAVGTEVPASLGCEMVLARGPPWGHAGASSLLERDSNL